MIDDLLIAQAIEPETWYGLIREVAKDWGMPWLLCLAGLVAAGYVLRELVPVIRDLIIAVQIAVPVHAAASKSIAESNASISVALQQLVTIKNDLLENTRLTRQMLQKHMEDHKPGT